MRVSTPVLAFAYAGNKESILHTMDARKRFLLYFLIQITLYRSLPLALHGIAGIAFLLHLVLRVPLRSFFRSLSFFSIIFAIIILSSLAYADSLLEGLLIALLRCERIAVSLLFTNIFLACSTQQSIVRTIAWISSIVALKTRTLALASGFCFTFLQLIFLEAHRINEALQLRNIRGAIRYIVLFSTALLRNLYEDIYAIEDRLEARNYQMYNKYHFSHARGEYILLVLVVAFCTTILLLPI